MNCYYSNIIEAMQPLPEYPCTGQEDQQRLINLDQRTILSTTL